MIVIARRINVVLFLFKYMTDIISNILEIINDILFWKRKRKRRKFEKENNLPKKKMINPLTLIIIILFIILLVLKFIIAIV